MKDLNDLNVLDVKSIRFNLWEKYGKRRIYINAGSDMKLFIEQTEKNTNTDFGGVYINNEYDSLLFDDVDLFLAIKGVSVMSASQTFGDIVNILKNEGLLK